MLFRRLRELRDLQRENVWFKTTDTKKGKTHAKYHELLPFEKNIRQHLTNQDFSQKETTLKLYRYYQNIHRSP